MPAPVIAIYDIGKTNKKLFLFNEDYKIVGEWPAQFGEWWEEDGDPCADLEHLSAFIRNSFHELATSNEYSVKAINVAAYGASFVYVDSQGEAIAPLYNYLKSYPEELKKRFYETYGGEVEFSFRTASPVLGSLNSVVQLDRIKYEKPGLFRKIKYALHLPQFVSSLLTGKAYSEVTSIGCHTNLWDFGKNSYHEWVSKEGVAGKLPPLVPSDNVSALSYAGKSFHVGVGLHDSSAALIPYLLSFTDPFVMISTGTWCISLNPFNHEPLTEDELASDCLCYMQYTGKPVKASRLFAGQMHDAQVARIAAHFHLQPDFFANVAFNPELYPALTKHDELPWTVDRRPWTLDASSNDQRFLYESSSAEESYHRLMFYIMTLQHFSTKLVLHGSVKNFYVDGGFSQNPVYMNMLASFFPDHQVFAASMGNATALGAALAIHDQWNTKTIFHDLIALKHYKKGGK